MILEREMDGNNGKGGMGGDEFSNIEQAPCCFRVPPSKIGVREVNHG